MTAAPLRWGVIGCTSWVARDAVIPALAGSPSAQVVAVASRDVTAATAVAARVGATAHATYEALLADPAVEAVYIPLPNGLHLHWVEAAARAGRHVLCEKPLGMDAADAASMIAACREAGVLLVEACMAPHHPRSRAVRAVIRSGELGTLSSLSAAFRFPLDDASNHRWRRDMGGGALLDVGVYCLQPVMDAFGDEALLSVSAAVAMRGEVDAATRAWLDFGGGRSAVIDASFDGAEAQRLEVVGAAATLVVDRPFTSGPDDTTIELRHRDGRCEVRDVGGGNAYRLMVEDMAAAVRERRPPLHGTDRTLAVAGLMDAVRSAAGRSQSTGRSRPVSTSQT